MITQEQMKKHRLTQEVKDMKPLLETWSGSWVVSGWIPTPKDFIFELNEKYPVLDFENETPQHSHNREVMINERFNKCAKFKDEVSARKYAAQVVRDGSNTVYVISPTNWQWSLDNMVEHADRGSVLLPLRLVTKKIQYSHYV